MGDLSREEAVESRWEAAPAVLVAIALQLVLALASMRNGWQLWSLPGWVWLIPVVPEIVLVAMLGLARPHRRLVQMGVRREVALVLLAIVSVANALALTALVGSLVTGQERSGGRLLLEASAIWGTNVIMFALWFWFIDRGGPARRVSPSPGFRDWQFPQDENPGLAEPDWHPRLLDYAYLSFTNAIAFSPTDAMPLTRRAKGLMLVESAVSALAVLLVAARAVNVLR